MANKTNHNNLITRGWGERKIYCSLKNTIIKIYPLVKIVLIITNLRVAYFDTTFFYIYICEAFVCVFLTKRQEK